VRIFENPYPTFAIQSLGSLKGNYLHGRNSALLADRLTRPFSQEAQEDPPNAFHVNMTPSIFTSSSIVSLVY
jgi:hypothetical protein